MTLGEYLNEKTTLLSRAGIPDAENEAWLCLMEGTGLSRSALRFSLAKALAVGASSPGAAPDPAEGGTSVTAGDSSSEDRIVEDGEKILLPESVFTRLEEIFSRRAGHEPLAYIVGSAPFYDLSFSVRPGVLIPRFDTEILVETALSALGFPQMLPGAPAVPQVPTCGTGSADPNFRGSEAAPLPEAVSNTVTNAENQAFARPARILDLCTGSGCVGITIAHELQKKGVPFDLTMTDISPEAAAVAEENGRHILGERNWKVEVADLWPDRGCPMTSVGSEERDSSSLPGVTRPNPMFDLIVSNPPYVTKSEMEALLPEVRDHEPAMALTDDGDGLLFYRRIVSGILEYLAPGGVLAVEHGAEQGPSVRDLMQQVLSGILTIQDYGGHDRVTCGARREEAWNGEA